MSENKTRTINRYHGWEIQEVQTLTKTLYMAYFDLGSNKMPLMLSDSDLEGLKSKINSVYVLHGKLVKKQSRYAN